ncbi:MAG: PAS domain S-box protein [Nitrospiraceae bacterium]|nr:MAG: PAS domain S-box protein [Nitrospiraceae bacterium]
MRFNYRLKIALLLVLVLAVIWIVEAAVHVIFFHEENFFTEVFVLEVHELWMRFFTIIVASVMGIIIYSLVNKQRSLKFLKESEKKFRGLVESTYDWIWEVDENAVYTYVSPRIIDILGYEAEEVLGKTPFDLMPPQEAQRIAHIFASIAVSQRPFSEIENTNIHKDGRRIILETSGTPVFDMNGTFRGYPGIDRDITERKRLENAVLEIEEKERRRIGHDLHDGLGQLLSAIAFKCQALENVLENNVPDEAVIAGEITSLAEKAKDNTRHLSRGLLPLEMEERGLMVALEELASNTEKMFDLSCVLMCDRPVEISNQTAELHLFRIAQEAVHNAARHGSPEHIGINFVHEHDEIKMTNTDDGEGISEPNETKDGLGLKIMQYRAGMIGASCEIKPLPAGGTQVICVYKDPVNGKGVLTPDGAGNTGLDCDKSELIRIAT